MNNLGLYSKMTKCAKQCGGPEKFMLLVGFAGYGTFRTCEAVIRKSYRIIKQKRLEKSTKYPLDDNLYTALLDYVNEDVALLNKSLFRIINIDGDAVIIAIENDDNNPYVIPIDFLRNHTNYPLINNKKGE